MADDPQESKTGDGKWEGREQALRMVFAWVILTAWIVSFILSAVLKGYNPPTSVQGLAIGAAGYLFSAPMIRSIRRKD